MPPVPPEPDAPDTAERVPPCRATREAPYDIVADVARDLIRMRLRRFWTVAIVERFAADQQRAARALRCGRGGHRVLCESAGPPQSQAVIAAMQALVIDIPNKAARFALIPSGAISQLQARRLLVRPDMAIFADVAAAEEWLFGPHPPAHSAA